MAALTQRIDAQPKPEPVSSAAPPAARVAPDAPEARVSPASR